MIRRILAAHGGAEWSEAAFDFALDLASKYKAGLTVLSVVRLPSVRDDEETQALIEDGKSRYKSLSERLHKKAAAAKVEMRAHVAIGHPAEQIIERAESEKSDLIVLGHRHRTSLGRWLLGSVSDRVMDHAPCSVIVIKAPVKHE